VEEAARLAEALGAVLRWDGAGLIPAIAQDWLDGAVLMLAWMNKEALQCTLESGEVHYWSRSRQELWHKGALRLRRRCAPAHGGASR
jgi:phosphoribosyl-ATP pyrophosphohydrolase/phosphoribosyl-AMP cyclohydrolase